MITQILNCSYNSPNTSSISLFNSCSDELIYENIYVAVISCKTKKTLKTPIFFFVEKWVFFTAYITFRARVY